MQRRSFLKKATLGTAAAGGAVLAAPVVAQQLPTLNWRLASSFPRSADAIYSAGDNFAKYITEATDGKFSIRALPAGEIEAAKALGMSRGLMLRRIVLPAALRRALPAYGNEAIFMLHGTSLASVVTLLDLTGAARQLYSKYYLPFEAFIMAGAFYFVLTLSLVGLFRWAENRWLKPMMRR